MVRTAVDLTRRTVRAWIDDDATRWSAAIAYYSVVSLAPLVVLAASVLGRVMAEPAAERWVLGELHTLAGPQAAQVAATVLDEVPALSLGSLGALLTAALLVVAATAVFANLQRALNWIWGVEAQRGLVGSLVRPRVTAFAVVLVFAGLMVVSVILSTVLGWLAPVVGALNAVLPFVTAADLISSLVLLWLAVAAVYWFLPDVEIRWRDVWIGALVTAVLLVLGKHLLSWFLARKAAASLYGTAGSIFLLLLWVYYSTLVFFLGAEFTQVWAEYRGREIEPSEHAVRIVRATNDASAMGG